MHSNAGIRVQLNEGHCQLQIVVKLRNNILRSFSQDERIRYRTEIRELRRIDSLFAYRR